LALGWVGVHLLASALLSHCGFWTRAAPTAKQLLSGSPVAMSRLYTRSGIPRFQTSQQFVRLAGLDQLAPARGFHRCDGIGVGIERLERQRLFAATRTSSRRKASETVSPIFFSAAAAFLLVRSSMRARTMELSGMAPISLDPYCCPNAGKCPPPYAAQ